MSEEKLHKILFGALCLFAFSLPLSKSAANIILTLFWAGAITFAVVRRDVRAVLRVRSTQPLLPAFGAMAAVAAAGVLFTEKLPDGIAIMNKIAGLALVYTLTAVILDVVSPRTDEEKTSEKVLLFFIAGTACLDLIGVLSYAGIVGNKKFVLPVAPLHVHSIWFANLNAVGLYAAAAFFLYSGNRISPRTRRALMLFVPLALFSILFSTSRTAWLGILCTVLALAYLFAKKRAVFFLAAAAAVGAGLLAYALNPIVQDRVDKIFTEIAKYSAGNADTSVGSRFLMWKAAFSMFLANPLVGVGTGDYVPTMTSLISSGEYPEFLRQFNQPHNMYLFSLATNGIPGLAALLYVFYRIFHLSLRVPAAPERKFFVFLATAVAIHYLVAGLTDSLFNIFLLRFTFALIMGICLRQSLKIS